MSATICAWSLVDHEEGNESAQSSHPPELQYEVTVKTPEPETTT